MTEDRVAAFASYVDQGQLLIFLSPPNVELNVTLQSDNEHYRNWQVEYYDWENWALPDTGSCPVSILEVGVTALMILGVSASGATCASRRLDDDPSVVHHRFFVRCLAFLTLLNTLIPGQL